MRRLHPRPDAGSCGGGIVSQKSLLDPKPAEFVIPEETPRVETGLIASEPQPAALLEFRRAFMLMEPAQMLDALGQYKDCRQTLRAWFLSMMTEGIHYGYTPGCEPKWCDSSGKPCSKADAWGTLSYNGKVSLESWCPKPSLYAAGADLVCDTMWVRDTYASDMEAWQQLGSVAGNIIRKCQLHSRITEEFIGEGTGARTLGQKKGDLNNSVKMADKSAKVCAVLNCWGLRELFTQDDAPPGPEKRPSPAADPNAKTAASRSDRITEQELRGVWERWLKSSEGPEPRTPAQKTSGWLLFVKNTVNREFDYATLAEWTKEDLNAVAVELSERGA